MKRVIALALVLAALTSGCALNGLGFKQDHRVEIAAPTQNQRVTLPVDIAWTVRDFDGYFAVFFDRSPMRPNDGLLSLVEENDPCRSQSVCPDARWLRDRHIFVTKKTSLKVSSLADNRYNDRSEDRHEMTIVLLDSSGKRMGESAFVTEFILDREAV